MKARGMVGRRTVSLAVIMVASCALPELTIDPSIDDSDEGGAGGTSGSQGGNGASGSTGSGGTGTGGSDGGTSSGGTATGGTSSGGTGKGGSSGGGTAGKGGTATGGSSGTSGTGPECTTADECDPGMGCCNEQCRDLELDEAHCGACNERCPAVQVCEGGECVCPTGDFCSNRCVDLDDDIAHCGACDSACAVDQTCTNGTCTGPCGATFSVNSAGWMTSPGASGCWRGYAWVAFGPTTTTTVTPTNFSSCGTPCSLCIRGTVAATSDYSGFSMLGVSINQATGNPQPMPIVPSGNALEISYTVTAGVPVRLQLNGATSDIDPNQRWCADLPTASGTVTIPYTQFRTNCWDNTGTAYSRQAITGISASIPGGMNAIPYDFCLRSLRDL